METGGTSSIGTTNEVADVTTGRGLIESGGGVEGGLGTNGLAGVS